MHAQDGCTQTRMHARATKSQIRDEGRRGRWCSLQSLIHAGSTCSSRAGRTKVEQTNSAQHSPAQRTRARWQLWFGLWRHIVRRTVIERGAAAPAQVHSSSMRVAVTQYFGSGDCNVVQVPRDFHSWLLCYYREISRAGGAIQFSVGVMLLSSPAGFSRGDFLIVQEVRTVCTAVGRALRGQYAEACSQGIV